MGAEQSVVDAVQSQIDRAGRYRINVHGDYHGASTGAPDVVTLDSDGRFLAVECKGPREEPYPTQWLAAADVVAAGGRYVVAYGDFDLASVDSRSVPVLRVPRFASDAERVAWAYTGASAPRRGATFELSMEY